MEAFAAAAAAAGVVAGSGGPVRPLLLPRRAPARPGAGRVRLLPAPPRAASSPSGGGGELPQLDKWDMMELEFGRFLGEDPKLTLAKILVKKSDPDASSLDVEKLMASKKDKLDDILREFLEANKQGQGSRSPESRPPVDLSGRMEDKQSLSLSRPVMGNPMDAKSSLSLPRPVPSKPKEDKRPLTLARPVGSKPKEAEPHPTLLRAAGSKKKEDEPLLTLLRPVGSKPKEVKRGKLVQDSWPSKQSLAAGTESSEVKNTSKKSDVDINLPKPTVYQSEHDDDLKSKLKMKPNIVLKMRKDLNENLSNISLFQRPEVVNASATSNREHVSAGSDPLAAGEEDRDEVEEETNALDETSVTSINYTLESSGLHDDPSVGLQLAEQSFIQDIDTSATSSDFSMLAFLQGKPKRKDSSVKSLSPQFDAEKMDASDHSQSYINNGGNVLSSKLEDINDSDWTRLEHYANTGEKVEVELINCSVKGFVVSLDSLIGFLPYRNLSAKWKFLAFETWLRRNGVDPSKHKQNLGIEEAFKVNDKNIESESGRTSEVANQHQGSLMSNMKFEDLLRMYNEEKSKFLSSFIGQRLRVSVVLADRNAKRIFFSMKPKESEEMIQKKKSLMARLNVGDIVKCCIKRFVYYGIFVEVEGVTALIQQWEVSWDDTLDPSLSYKIGQVVDGKVTQLDYTNNRIFLSLKDVKPNGQCALEGVVGDETSLGVALEAVQADFEWSEVEALIQEIKKIEQVKDVYKGRFFQSPGLAPTFQVYMTPLVGTKYKLLARHGNNVQEVMVETSLDKEQLKEAILTCTNRVN